MDKTQLKRHDLVYPSSIGRARLKQVFLNEMTGEKAFLAADIFRADSVIPGIVRRAEVLSADVIRWALCIRSYVRDGVYA